jgi:hypothetical protein
MVLRHRLDELTRELQQGTEEKKRLEEALKRCTYVFPTALLSSSSPNRSSPREYYTLGAFS